MTRSRMFRTTLAIVLLCMCVPLVAMWIASAVLTEGESARTFHNERTQQLSLIKNTCDLLLDECNFVYYQLVMEEDVSHALDLADTALPLSYRQLQNIQTLLRRMSVVVGSRPLLYSIVAYPENPHELVISSRFGLVRLSNEPDGGWYDAWVKNSARGIFARPTRLTLAGDMLTIYFPLSSTLRRQPGVMVFHYYLADMEALLPAGDGAWFVLDADGTTLFISGNSGLLTDALRAEILQMEPGASLYPESLPDTVLYQVTSGAYGWRFVNVTDRTLLTAAAGGINRALLVVASASLLVGVIIAVLLTRRATRPILRILSMIERMNAGETLTLPQQKRRDEYEYISYNLLGNYMSRQRLNEQLTQRQLRLREAQMLALQAQINPHFLYNTMEAINWRAIKALGSENSISHMITTLSELLRYALERPEDLVPLSREMAHGEQYASLMAYRLGPVFALSFDVAPKVQEVSVPKLILQPLIENAIQHGVQNMQGNGVITIAAQVRNGFMHITVSDNGTGMELALLETIRQQLASFDGLSYKHIGLLNVYQRVRLATKDQAQMTLDSTQGEGTRVKLVFPITEGGIEDADNP